MDTPTHTAAGDAFRSARDFLLARRDDPAGAARDFRWPSLDRFNWALDHFDVLAHENDRPALWIVEDDGSERKRSFREMSARSAQVGNFLRAQDVRRGDRILLMLGNELALWDAARARPGSAGSLTNRFRADRRLFGH